MTDANRGAVYAQILERVYVLKASPTWWALPAAEQQAFDSRMTDHALAWSEVSEDDKALIRRGEFEVSAGLSQTLVAPEERGDWEAIDAALDAEDDAALDAALFTVGHGLPREPWLGDGGELDRLDDVDDPYTDDSGDLMDVDDLPATDDGWVGV